MNSKLSLLILLICNSSLLFSMENDSKEPIDNRTRFIQLLEKKRKELEAKKSGGSKATDSTSSSAPVKTETSVSSKHSAEIISSARLPIDSSPLARCTQIDVARQEGADCGYHALKNSFLIVKYINSPQEMLKSVNDKSFIDPIFGSIEAPWKFTAINIRANKIAKEIITERIALIHQDKLTPEETILFNFCKYRIPELVSDLVNNYRRSTIETSGSASGGSGKVKPRIINSYNFNTKLILDRLFFVIKKYAVPGKSDKISRELLDKFFSKLKPIDFTIENDTIIHHSDKKLAETYNWTQITHDGSYVGVNVKDGSWIKSDEMQMLINQEKEREGSIFTFDTANIYPIEANLSLEVFMMEENCHNLATQVRDIENGVALDGLIVYMGAHWVTVIVNKQKGSKAQYILANSLSGNLKKNAAVCNIIGFLEGKRVLPETDEVIGSSSSSLFKLGAGIALSILAVVAYKKYNKNEKN